MGYTHYWETAGISQHSKRFSVAVAEMSEVIRNSPVPLAGPYGTGEPEVSATKVLFNGAEPFEHETFMFPDEDSWFCKTADKPYDIVVVACLAIAKDIFGTEINVSSDGARADWDAGVALASQVLGRMIDNPIVDEQE